jgi:hypothetical protein
VTGDLVGQNFTLSGGLRKVALTSNYVDSPRFADLNRDGYLDLVAEYTLVNQNGAFPGSISIDYYTKSDVADIDNDGIPDVIKEVSGNGVYALLDSLGKCQQLNIAGGYYTAPDIALGDYNNDGKNEVLEYSTQTGKNKWDFETIMKCNISKLLTPVRS